MATRGKRPVEFITDFEEAWTRKGRKEGLLEGEKKGEKKGELKGALKARRETAQQMKADGLPLETIQRYTGLSEAEISDL